MKKALVSLCTPHFRRCLLVCVSVVCCVGGGGGEDWVWEHGCDERERERERAVVVAGT